MIHSNSSLNILIIEDNSGDFELVQDYLGEYGLPSIDGSGYKGRNRYCLFERAV